MAFVEFENMIFVVIGLIVLFMMCVLGRMCYNQHKRQGPTNISRTAGPTSEGVGHHPLTPPPKYDEVALQVFFVNEIQPPPSYEEATKSSVLEANHI